MSRLILLSLVVIHPLASVPPVKATLKQKFVSCPAGGHNSGQSGGRKIFCFSSFFPLYINGQEKKGEKKEKKGKCEKKMPTRHLKSHLAGGQETNLFLRVA